MPCLAVLERSSVQSSLTSSFMQTNPLAEFMRPYMSDSDSEPDNEHAGRAIANPFIAEVRPCLAVLE